MGKKLRVLAIGHSYTIAVNRALAREVAKSDDFEVTVAAPNAFRGDLRPVALEPEPADSRLRLVGIDVRNAGWIHTLKYDDRALSKLLHGEPFDVVHAWQEPYIRSGCQIAQALGEAPSRFCFATFQNRVKWYPPPFSKFEKLTLRRSQGWIAHASLVYQAMLRRQYPAERGRVITLAVDNQLFQPLSAEERRESLAELGLEPPVIGFVGRLNRAKGVDVLLAALEEVRAKNWSMLFLGSGPYAPRIEQWARQRGRSDRVRVTLAKHHEVARRLGVMDLLVAPSQTWWNWTEQFGRMLVEAFACGVPVIGSTSGEIPFVIGDAGMIVPEKNVRQWATAIDQLLGDPALRASFVQKGFERVRQYSVDSVVAQYRDFYHWLADQPIGRQAA